MKVDFDNLRKKIAVEYNRLVKKLNTISKNIDKSLIEEEMNDLRNLIATLLSVYDDEKNIKWIDYNLDIFGE